MSPMPSTKAGIVHRDLKPGNIMLTKTGGTKLFDFGLAKTMARAEIGELSSLPTEAKPLTEKGAILGTFQYMAPEQLEGKEVDGRADIFTFGAVLYEMVTGKKAFAGESQASIIAAILEREPPRLTEIEPVTPPALEHLVSGCLSKDRDARWQSAGDVERQLRWIAEGGSTQAAPAALREKGRSALVLAALITIAAVSFGLWALLRPAAPATTTRLSIALPPGQELAG